MSIPAGWREDMIHTAPPGGQLVYVPDLPETRLRRVSPSLRLLRQAWEDAEGYAAETQAMEAFLAALDTVSAPAELDTLDRAPPEPAGPGPVAVAAVLMPAGLLFWAALIGWCITGSVLLLTAGVIAAYLPALLVLLIPARRHPPGQTRQVV